MGIYEGFMPKVRKEGYCGYYPVTNEQEWKELPAVYKAMEWFPIEMNRNGYTEKTTVEYVEFDVVYMTPYKVSGTFRVHRQEVQKILFCSFPHSDCHLYSISGVVFQNGERWGAKWHQDSRTGAFEVLAYNGKRLGTQGGFLGFVPNNIERTEDGGWKCNWNQDGNITHYEFSNPFEHL